MSVCLLGAGGQPGWGRLYKSPHSTPQGLASVPQAPEHLLSLPLRKPGLASHLQRGRLPRQPRALLGLHQGDEVPSESQVVGSPRRTLAWGIPGCPAGRGFWPGSSQSFTYGLSRGPQSSRLSGQVPLCRGPVWREVCLLPLPPPRQASGQIWNSLGLSKYWPGLASTWRTWLAEGQHCRTRGNLRKLGAATGIVAAAGPLRRRDLRVVRRDFLLHLVSRPAASSSFKALQTNHMGPWGRVFPQLAHWHPERLQEPKSHSKEMAELKLSPALPMHGRVVFVSI